MKQVLLNLNPKDVRLGIVVTHRRSKVDAIVVSIRDEVKYEGPVKVITLRDLLSGVEVEVESMRKLIRRYVWQPGYSYHPKETDDAKN